MTLPGWMHRRLESAANAFLDDGRMIDFTRPRGEAALLPPDSMSWRVFKNPVALFIGGLAAVILELAEPCVRTGVWQHSSFRKDPLGRLRRTGLAAMVTVYGARSISEPMIAGVVRMHDKVRGETARGVQYSANDERLLTWVQATATFGIAEAYSRYVKRLDREAFDALYRESASASRLYGALGAPSSSEELLALFDAMRPRLEPSPIVFEFLKLMRQTPAVPPPLQWTQRALVRAAVDLIPQWVRQRLGFTAQDGLRGGERALVRALGMLSDSIPLMESPAAQSCVRLGLPAAHLYTWP